MTEAEEGPLDAEGVNMACFRLSRQLEQLSFCVPQAAPVARRLLRVVGRLVIDTGAAGADPATWPNTEEMVLQWVDEALAELGYEVRPGASGGRPELARGTERQDLWT